MSSRNWYAPLAIAVVALVALGGLFLASFAMMGSRQAPAPASPRPQEVSTPAAAEAQPVPESTFAIRTYEVPEHMKLRALNILKETTPFNVMPGPANRIVVAAPEAMQAGVETFLKELGAVEDKPMMMPATIEMTYWLVLGTHGDPGKTSGVPEIQDALTTVTASQGPLAFTLLERVTLLSVDGEEGTTGGRRVHVEQQVGEREGAILANLSIGTTHGQRLKTRVRLKEGQTLVLGQVGTTPELRVGTAEELVATEDNAVIFFVVRARVLRDNG